MTGGSEELKRPASRSLHVPYMRASVREAEMRKKPDADLIISLISMAIAIASTVIAVLKPASSQIGRTSWRQRPTRSHVKPTRSRRSM